MKKKKDQFVYLVYCNPEPPIIYSVYKKKQDAVRHAISLIRYRKNMAKQKGHEFGYYHFCPLPQPTTLKWMKNADCPYYYDLTLFTTCLKIEDKDKNYSDDACHVRVCRRVLQ